MENNKMTLKLNVLTLNCWGVFVPFACQHRSERMRAIASTLSNEDYDVVVLEEVWTQADYEQLCSKIVQRMPFTHYFHSGNIGSGVCIFSKHVICETFQYRFSLNGYAHKIFNGDWFGGKSIGLAKIKVQDFVVNVYGAHLHAQYNDPDEYEAHRIAQCFEMGQFIRHTSDACDLVIVAGDLNFRPDQLGYKVIRSVGNVEDSWVVKRVKSNSEDEETTCDRPDNPYTSPVALKKTPNGVKLDYIMFRSNSGVDAVCEKCCTTMQKVPNETYHYSDHAGVSALFTVKKNITAMGKQREIGEIENYLSDVLVVVDNGIKKAKASRVYYIVGFLLSVMAVVFISSNRISCDSHLVSVILDLGQLVVTGYLMFCGWMVVITTGRELNALLAVKKDVNSTLKSSSMYK